MGSGVKPPLDNRLDDAAVTRLLERLQCNSFAYFVHEVNPENGLVLDKTSDNWPASVAAVGMALTVFPIGVERELMARDEAVKRTLTTLRFFAESEQSNEPDATGYKGFYYHFLDMKTGKRAWNCELSSIDTALFIAGVLTAGAYFRGEGDSESEIRQLADTLYSRVEWDWMRNNSALLCHGWKPESGFLQWHWEGYQEALMLYILALGSPTFPIEENSYAAWLSSYQWKTIYGIEFAYAGPLFIHQMSHVWIDFRGIRDAFMRDRDCDYFENSRRATLVQQQYAIRNPLDFEQYGEFCWGITASDGPGEVVKTINGVQRQFFDYVARGVPYGPDDGTLAPWAVAASLPFAPEIVLPTIDNFSGMHLRAPNPYGFKASFSPTYHLSPDEKHKGRWVSPYHFGINEGPTVVMIENYRSGMIWTLMRQCPYVRAGLRRAGFTGGWLEAA